MANVLSAEKRSFALQLLVEGNSIRSIERLTGVHRDTIMRLSVRFGQACRQFMDEEMRGLKLSHIQCDEIWTFVGKNRGAFTLTSAAQATLAMPIFGRASIPIRS